MATYFKNPEIKKSSAVMLICLGVFLVINAFWGYYSFNKVKNETIEKQGMLIGAILEKYPQEKGSIVENIIKNESSNYKDEGVKLLKEYGYSNKTSLNLIDYLKNPFYMNLIFSSLNLIIFATIIFVFNSNIYISIYNKVRNLTIGAEKALEEDYAINLFENGEGDFSKMTYSFSNMREVMKNNMITLKREKKFLVDLLSDISHQLKTPLSSLIVFNEILMSSDLDYEQQNMFLNKSKIQLERMEWLIRSLLKIAKLDAGAIVFNREKSGISQILEDSISAMSDIAERKKVTLKFIKNEELYMLLDRQWMVEALVNIIKNAIEHTQNNGLVQIEFYESPIYNRVIIRDNGEGIPKEDIRNIFKRFYKGKKSIKSDSVGIGLSLSKAIIEAHGGYIEVKSQENIGTEFIVTFLKY